MNWARFQQHNYTFPSMDFAIDISRMGFPDDFFEQMEPKITKAFESMDALESGAKANPDENRMVGHYWLRAAELAPSPSIIQSIRDTLGMIHEIAAKVHSGELQGAIGRFENLLVIGIGGSALGPQFVSQALGHPLKDKLRIHFFDNTDPDGLDLVLSRLKGKLGKTLVVVISKSGGTPETRNGMLVAENAWRQSGMDFPKHAIAVTGKGSKLDNHARDHGWLYRLPMWDWVGGRTSETGPVGLLPAALQGLDIDGILEGAAAMDVQTRSKEPGNNPAMLLALMWYYATNGKGEKDMVVLPYKDRLELFSKYLQQLVMESLGKELDLDGNTVNQGIAVYGNKGSTDQHAYVQQLREGTKNFFATFIEVLKESEVPALHVENGITAGDYLEGFLLGTREALYENGRESITLTIREVTPQSVGQLIALFERAVGYYATFVNINAYHQPGVEAGKKAAASILDLNLKIQAYLKEKEGVSYTTEYIANAIGEDTNPEITYKLLCSLAAKPDSKFHSETASEFKLTRFLYKHD
jgi:glucose-6-phosphate isomerase